MSTITGSQVVQEQPSNLSFAPGVGHRTTRVFKGPAAAILAEYYAAAAAGWSCTLRKGYGGIDTLEASKGGDGVSGGPPVETPQETWTLLPNVVEKDLLEADVSYITGLTWEEKESIRKGIQNPDDPDIPAITSANGWQVWVLMQHGARTWQVEQPVLQGSYLCTGSYVSGYVTTNVNNIFTNAQLASLEGANTTLIIPLPSSSRSTNWSTSAWAAGDDKPAGRYGWRKRYPTVEQVGGDLYRVSVQYEYGLWSSLLYASAS